MNNNCDEIAYSWGELSLPTACKRNCSVCTLHQTDELPIIAFGDGIFLYFNDLIRSRNGGKMLIGRKDDVGCTFGFASHSIPRFCIKPKDVYRIASCVCVAHVRRSRRDYALIAFSFRIIISITMCTIWIYGKDEKKNGKILDVRRCTVLRRLATIDHCTASLRQIIKERKSPSIRYECMWWRMAL